MFVVSKRNIILPGPSGEKFHMPRDYMGPVPAWAEDSTYLKALEADGKVIISATGRDKDIDAAEKKKRGKKPPKDPEQEVLPEEPSGEEKPEPSGEETQEGT